LTQLQHLLTRALQATAALWPPIALAYAWVQQAVQILANADQHSGADVRAAYEAWVTQMAEQKSMVGVLSDAIEHFCHITENFAAGLFHCYDVADRPRTNNDLEQCFGSVRYHERRTTGRRGAIPGLVVRGAVRILAVIVTKRRLLEGTDLQPVDEQAWRRLRQQLQYRREARRQQWRFRKHPATYLADIETRLLQ